MLTIGFVGDQGKVSAPLETSFCLLKQAAVWEPDGITRPLMLLTNGKYEVKTTEPGKRIVAGSQTPIIWKWEDRFLRDDKFKEFKNGVFKQLMPLVDFVEGNDDALFEKLQNKSKMVDVQFETENLIPERKSIIFRDRMEVVIGLDNEFRSLQFKHVQHTITEFLRTLKMDPDPYPIGYGFFDSAGETLKLVRRPNRYFRVGYYSVAEMDLIREDTPKRSQIRTAAYTYLAAYALMRFHRGKRFDDPSDDNDMYGDDNWNIHDFAAMVTMILSGLVGFGEEQSTSREYTATDIEAALEHAFGFGYSISNRLLWDITKDNMANYMLFCLLLAFAANRIKPQVKDYEWAKAQGRGSERIGELLNDANHGTYESIGSMSNLYLPIPRNDCTWKGQPMMCLPVILDCRELKSEQARLNQANHLKILRQYHPVSFTNVTVDRGEIPGNTIDYTSSSQKWMMFKPTTDARIVEENYEWRDVTKYKFPRWGIVRNGLPDKAKRTLFMIGLFMNGDSSLKDGVPVKVSMNILQPVNVAYYRTKMLETAVIKEGSDTPTNVKAGIVQKPKPSAGMTGVAKVTTELGETNEMPRPGTKKDTVPDKVIQELPGEEPDNSQVPNESEPAGEGSS